MAAPPDTPTGRPFKDQRNNFRWPNYNAGLGPSRDLDADPIRVCVFDIEATGLDASFGRVLCAVAQFYGPRERKVWRADEYPGWKEGKRADDSGLVADILVGLESADIVIAHNGTKYDLPFLRTRALIHRLPPVHPKKIIDPVMQARTSFRFHSNSLDSITTVLGTKARKTPLEPQMWIRAIGNGECMDEIVAHCEMDVDALAEAARLLAPYIRQIDAIGSWRQ